MKKLFKAFAEAAHRLPDSMAAAALLGCEICGMLLLAAVAIRFLPNGTAGVADTVALSNTVGSAAARVIAAFGVITAATGIASVINPENRL